MNLQVKKQTIGRKIARKIISFNNFLIGVIVLLFIVFFILYGLAWSS